MSNEDVKANVGPSPAEEVQEEAEATLSQLKPAALTGVSLGTSTNWAAMLRGMPRTPPSSTAVRDVMRILHSRQMGLTSSLSFAHSEQFLGIARQLQAQHAGIAKAFGASSVLTDTLRGVRMQQGMFAEALKVQQAVVGTAALASLSRSLQLQEGALAKSLAILAVSGARLPLAELAASSSATRYKAMNANFAAAGAVSSISQMLAASGAITRPLRAYSEFSARTLEQLADCSPDSREIGPLARSLEVAEDELMETAVAAADVLLLVSDDASGPGPRPIRRLNLLSVARRELLAYDRSTDTLLVDEGFVISLAERVAAKCRSVQATGPSRLGRSRT